MATKKTTPTTPTEIIKEATNKLADLAAELAEEGKLPGIGQITLTAAAVAPGMAEWSAQAKYKAPSPVKISSRAFSSPLFPDKNE